MPSFDFNNLLKNMYFKNNMEVLNHHEGILASLFKCILGLTRQTFTLCLVLVFVVILVIGHAHKEKVGQSAKLFQGM